MQVAVLTGEGDVFSAGFDLKEFELAIEDPPFGERLWASSDRYHRVVLNFPLPIVAAVNGPAIAGGFDLAVMCDVRIASENATFSHPEVTFGDVVYGPLHELVGGAIARDLCFTGRKVDAAEALSLHLVSQRRGPGRARRHRVQTAHQIARVPRELLLRTKAKALRRGGHLGRGNVGSLTMGALDVDTELMGGDGRYSAHLSEDWRIWGPNGGYLAALALRCAGEHSPFRRPASFTCHFLGVADFTDVELTARTHKRTKRVESLAVSMTQHGAPILEALVWTVGDVHGFEHQAFPMPDVPRPESLRSLDERVPDDVPVFPFWDSLELRPCDWLDDWETRAPGEFRQRGWYRFRPTPTFADPYLDAARCPADPRHDPLARGRSRPPGEHRALRAEHRRAGALPRAGPGRGLAPG